MSIELRLSDIAPPTAEPHHTIYTDVVNLPDPVKLGFAYKAFNYDAVTLYFQLIATCPGWTFPASTNEGAILTGANATYTHDQYGSRARPAAETVETITLTLKAYTDAGYTILKWTYVRDVTVWFIKSNDGTWTQDFLDNYDDGTVDGWAVTGSGGISLTIAIATDFVLSVPYSCKVEEIYNGPSAWFSMNKSFNTPNRAKVFMIANVRFDPVYNIPNFLGCTMDIIVAGTTVLSIAIPIKRWMRVVVPLPSNTVGVAINLKFSGSASGWPLYIYGWQDDFTIVSKD